VLTSTPSGATISTADITTPVLSRQLPTPSSPYGSEHSQHLLTKIEQCTSTTTQSACLNDYFFDYVKSLAKKPTPNILEEFHANAFSDVHQANKKARTAMYQLPQYGFYPMAPPVQPPLLSQPYYYAQP
jgi:hypothetical protein